MHDVVNQNDHINKKEESKMQKSEAIESAIKKHEEIQGNGNGL